ncbi:uncharacterized protein LOC133856763 [Alnus glutinosa]|uniref:uncharacterized protein LOC133856763 n=1 Tax=Alnus glutinosa TaxID=3517 RepID=UPI002D79707E|nr:uncharacterized protein LOC133856763 [Alnus glutinosa]
MFKRLKYGNKTCYMGHHRWLPRGHIWCRIRELFDGTGEHRLAPKELSNDELLRQLDHVTGVKFGKGSGTKRKRTNDELNWTKKSIFFELPYWSTLKLRHNLDVMHIEKNICDSVLGKLCKGENATCKLCARTLKVDVLKQMKDNIVIILCKLEQIFPPAFFDIMVHVAIHLPREAELARPVQYRWMYPIERTFGRYKRYVRNKARPEGSIAECYISDECLTFCSMYLRDIETRWNRAERSADVGQEEKEEELDVFSQRVRPLGAAKLVTLDENLFARAKWYVLSNCKDTNSYLNEQYQLIERDDYHDIQKKHEANFKRWFRDNISVVRTMQEMFHTKEYAQNRTTQNSGVVVRGEHKNSIIEFYGKLRNIFELRYPGTNRVFLFECDWWDTGSMKGMKMENGFTIVNTSRDSWKVVQKLTNRNIYDIPAIVERDDDQGMNADVYQERVCDGGNIAIVEDSTILCRDDPTIPIDELYVQLDPNLFVGNNPLIEEYDTNFDEEEELSSNNDTDSEHVDDYDHEDSSSSDSDAEYDDDMC